MPDATYSADPAIEYVNCSKSYGKTRAVHRINLQIPAGKTSVMIGPSGCGKSTLLRLLIGLIKPDTGHIYLSGTEVLPDVVLSLRRRIGYVIQDGGLFPHLSAAENVTLMARQLKLDSVAVAYRLRQLAEISRFPLDALGRFPVELSGGQRQRVSLMRSLMLDPDVLLMDEPLGALDPMIRADLQKDLKQIFQSMKKTVMLVTHDMGEAAFFGDLLILLRDGEIVQTGALPDFLEPAADPFVTNFISAHSGPFDGFRRCST